MLCDTFPSQTSAKDHPMSFHFLAATLAALTFVPALHAQQVFAPDGDRKASNVFVFSDTSEALAGASISYTPPTWQDSYDGMLEKLKGGNYSRLGKDWWTTFDTVSTLEIGGTKIEAGSYYLGLAVDKDGAFSLLIFDSKQAMKAGLLPFTTALYRGEAKAQIKVPLTFAKDSLKEVVVKMEIEIVADKKTPATGKFAIRWGKHELSAPVKFQMTGAKDDAAPKK
jgi:hypothetical protein